MSEIALRVRIRAVLAAAVLLLSGGVLFGSSASAGDVVYRPADGMLTFDGRGFGHGRGLSQYGAHGAGLRGLGYAQILAHYYGGAGLDSVSGMVRRVLVTGEDDDAVVTNAPGLLVRNEASGEVLDVGGRVDWAAVRVRPEAGLLRVEALQGGVWTAAWPPISGPALLEGPPTLRLEHPAGARTYRGSLRAALSAQAAKPLYVVSIVGLDDYVRGVVPAEMPSSWHPEALKAQAVAARSYGYYPCPQARGYPATALYDVVDTTACQVYSGSTGEKDSTNVAVSATAGQVLYYGSSVLRTEFSASNGGWTVAAGGAYVAKEDPFDAEGAAAVGQSGVHRWTGVRVPISKLENSFGTGLLREVRVIQRDGRGEWGGRVLRVRLVGDIRTVEVTGEQVRSSAGLRSAWFDLQSPIDVKHSALGGNAGLLGAPTTPEGPVLGGRNRLYQYGSIYWSPGTGANEVHGPIRDRWAALDWERSVLGLPTTDQLSTPNGVGRVNHFQAGSIFWTAGTGAHEVRGAIRDRWAATGWESGPLGFPTTGQLTTPNGVGRVNHFQGGSIFWTPGTGAQDVRGPIRGTWAALGWEGGMMGFPTSGQLRTPNGVGLVNHFQGGSIFYSPATGAREVTLGIRDAWARVGWENGRLGFPTTNQLVTPDSFGRVSHFQGGSIFWSPATGAHAVDGGIRNHWASTGWERGGLGYPVSDAYPIAEGFRQDFQRGSIIWSRSTGGTRIV